MRIKCRNCGKIYDYDNDETCPKCGEYTKPGRKYQSPELKHESKEIYHEKKHSNSDYRRSTSNRGNYTNRTTTSSSYGSAKDYNQPSQPRKRKSGLFVSRIIFAIIIITSFLPRVLHSIDLFDIFDFSDNEESIEELIPEEFIGQQHITSYFEDIAELPFGIISINQVNEISNEYENLDSEKVIAVNLSYIANDSESKNDINIDVEDITLSVTGKYGYVFDEDEKYTVNDEYYGNILPEEFYSETPHFDLNSIKNNDSVDGVIYFVVPDDVESFDFIITTYETDEDFNEIYTDYICSYKY